MISVERTAESVETGCQRQSKSEARVGARKGALGAWPRQVRQGKARNQSRA